MRYLVKHKKLSLSILLTSQLLFSQTSFSSGFQLNEVSPGLQGAATAGAAATWNDVSSMFNNPATLATLEQNQIYAGATFIAPHVRMSGATGTHTVNIPGNPPSSISGIVQGTTTQGDIAPWAIVPNAYIGKRLTDRLVVGLAIVSPFGLVTEYDSSSVLRFTAQKSSLMTIDINPTIAYKYNENWFFGAGLQFQYASAQFSNFNGPYTGIPQIDGFIAATQPTVLNGNGYGYGFNLGVLYSRCEGTRIGVGYRSQIVQDVSGFGREYLGPGPTVRAPNFDFSFNARTQVKAKLRIPAVLTISAAQDIENWTIKGTAQLTMWNTFNQLSVNLPDAFAFSETIPAKWTNSWLYAIGADYCLTPKWTLRSGIAYDLTPTRDQFRDPRIPDVNRVWLAAGFTHRITKDVSIDADYEHIFAPTQTVNVTQAAGVSRTSTLPLEVNHVTAKYRSSVDILGVAIRVNFC